LTPAWGQLDPPPAQAGWEFPVEEYRRRVEGARVRMAARGLDCLFLTSEKNIRYLTGFHTQIWVSPTRPRYVILPLEAEPVAIVLQPGMALTIEPSLVWPAPGGRGHRLMVHEENIVVTANGCELLTRRAAAELPVVG
jgi:Xaa-Pro aminopeptidase